MAKIQLSNGNVLMMSELHIGDQIQTGIEKVFFYGKTFWQLLKSKKQVSLFSQLKLQDRP